MRDRPLIVVATRLGVDVIDGHLDELKTTMQHFGPGHLIKALKRPRERPSSIPLRDLPPRREHQSYRSLSPQPSSRHDIEMWPRAEMRE